MGESQFGPWIVLLLLGAFHGLNPAMGWLFAVALGLQHGRSGAVWKAIPPLAAGHGLAIAAAVLVAVGLGVTLPEGFLKLPVAASLAGLGIYRLLRNRHPRFGGMQVGAAGLTMWSFLMASAHGAGLMVLPVFMKMTAPVVQAAAADPHAAHLAAATGPTAALLSIGIHSAGYLLMTALVAWLVYRWVGVGILRKAWINIDRIWALALIGTGALTLLI